MDPQRVIPPDVTIDALTAGLSSLTIHPSAPIKAVVPVIPEEASVGNPIHLDINEVEELSVYDQVQLSSGTKDDSRWDDCQDFTAQEMKSMAIQQDMRKRSPADRFFNPFSKLPEELRLMIWEFARPEARIVRPKWKGNKPDGYIMSDAPIPSMLHTCQESREVALKWYKLSFGTNMWREPRPTGNVYFDFSRDWLYVHCEKCNEAFCDCYMPLGSSADGQAITRIMFKISDDSRASIHFFVVCLRFKNSHHLLLLGDDVPKLQPEVQHSDFAESKELFLFQRGNSLQESYNKEKLRISTIMPHMAAQMNIQSIKRVRLDINPQTTGQNGFMEAGFKTASFFNFSD